jgi:hypothetical protein
MSDRELLGRYDAASTAKIYFAHNPTSGSSEVASEFPALQAEVLRRMEAVF